MFFKIGAREKFAIFTGKHLCWSLLLIKLQAFSCGYCEVLGTVFFKTILARNFIKLERKEKNRKKIIFTKFGRAFGNMSENGIGPFKSVT